MFYQYFVIQYVFDLINKNTFLFIIEEIMEIVTMVEVSEWGKVILPSSRRGIKV